MDSPLDREIEAALDVEPSPEFVARVRARVATEAIDATWWSGWRFVAASVTVAAVAVFIVVTIWPSSPDQQPETQVTAAPVSETAAAPSTVQTAAPVSERARPVARPRRATLPVRVVSEPSAPEVLISAGEAAALHQLFAAICECRVDPSVVPGSHAPPTPLPSIDEIVVTAVTVPPLTWNGSE